MKHVCLFGLGYTGKYLNSFLTEHGYVCSAFSAHTRTENSVLFNSRSGQDVQNLEEYLQKHTVEYALITFPPAEEDVVFWDILQKYIPCRLLLGTTGIYAGSGLLDENSPLIPDHPRKKSEEKFRAQGGSIFRLSGIYGPGRNPLNWLERVSLYPDLRQLNLIHVSDIQKSVLAWLQNPVLGEVFNIDDAQQHTWGDIRKMAEKKGISFPGNPGDEPDNNRFYYPGKRQKYYPEINFINFFEYMENQAFGE